MVYYYGVATPSYGSTFQTMRGPYATKASALAAYRTETNRPTGVPDILLEQVEP